VQAARETLAQRDPRDVAALATTVVAELNQELDATHNIAEEPLGPAAKALCFVFCGIPGIVFAALQESKGRSRRSREAWTWIAYGWLMRVGYIVLAVALSRL